MGSKQFNDILDECMERLLTGTETVEQCLQRYPEYATELEPLLRTAIMVNKAVDIKPSADFRARARYQLQTMMAKSKAPKRTPSFAPGWAIAVCAVLLVFVLGGGTVLAADGTTPGNPLYPVKLMTENVRVTLTGSEEKKVELYAAIAERRVTEMAQMVDKGKTRHLESSAKRLNTYYTKISELPLGKGSEAGMLLTAQSTSQSMPVTAVTTTTTTAAPTRAAPTTTPVPTTSSIPAYPVPIVTVTVPPATAPVPSTKVPEPTTVPSPEKSVYGTAESMDTASARDSAWTVSTSRDKLRNVLGYYAFTQPEKIRKLLDSDKVPEAVKPALRRALWASENGYRQALDNLDDDD